MVFRLLIILLSAAASVSCASKKHVVSASEVTSFNEFALGYDSVNIFFSDRLLHAFNDFEFSNRDVPPQQRLMGGAAKKGAAVTAPPLSPDIVFVNHSISKLVKSRETINHSTEESVQAKPPEEGRSGLISCALAVTAIFAFYLILRWKFN